MNYQHTKIIKMIYVLVLTVFVLTGCKETVVESSKIINFTIVDIKRPKHFRVSLIDENGKLYKDVSISKHCNRWGEVNVGTIVKLNTYTMKRGEDRWLTIDATSICPGN